MSNYFLIPVGIISFLLLISCTPTKSTSGTQHQLSEAYSLLHKIQIEVEEFAPRKNETVGILSIPAISAELPIIEGGNERESLRGVSHLPSSSYPLQGGAIKLTANHVSLFKQIGKVKLGDLFIVNLPYGSFTYQIEMIEKFSVNDEIASEELQAEELSLMITDGNDTLIFLLARPN